MAFGGGGGGGGGDALNITHTHTQNRAAIRHLWLGDVFRKRSRIDQIRGPSQDIVLSGCGQRDVTDDTVEIRGSRR